MGSFGAGHANAQQPNIVFIMADDMGWGDVSTPLTTLGDPSDFFETPAIADLATEGMAFTNAYANAVCAPTRTALLSGAYGPRSTNNVYTVGSFNSTTSMLVGVDQGTNGSNDKLPVATITMAETLQTSGYTTATVGKFHVTANANQIINSHGYDFNFGGRQSGGPGAYHAVDQMFGNSVDATLDPYAGDYSQAYVDANIKPYANGTSLNAIDALVGTAKHLTDAQTDAALDFMASNRTEPFFMQFSANAVHTPVDDAQARTDLLDKYENKPTGNDPSSASYGALVEGLDQGVARIVDYLQNTPDPRHPGQTLDQNTLVIFTSDNGGLSNVSHTGVLAGNKGNLREGGIRVPMVAWSGNPDLVDAGTVNDAVVMPIDYYPTFTSFAGGVMPEGQIHDGVNLTSVFADESVDTARENVYWHLPGNSGNGANRQAPATVTRSGDWKLTYDYETQSFALFDLANDLGETTNRAGDEPLVVADLGSDLLLWLEDVDAPLATLRSGTLELQINGRTYANGTITDYENQSVTISAGEEVPFVLDRSLTFAADFNFDGRVDLLDLDALGQNWQMAGGAFSGDATGDGFVNLLDLDLLGAQWQGNASWEAALAASGLSVPEPATFAVMLAAGGLVLRRRR